MGEGGGRGRYHSPHHHPFGGAELFGGKSNLGVIMAVSCSGAMCVHQAHNRVSVGHKKKGKNENGKGRLRIKFIATKVKD